MQLSGSCGNRLPVCVIPADLGLRREEKDQISPGSSGTGAAMARIVGQGGCILAISDGVQLRGVTPTSVIPGSLSRGHFSVPPGKFSVS